MPSGTFDVADVTALAEEIARDLEALGLQVELHRGSEYGPAIEATYGHGPERIMLMGHMDTVFPRRDYEPFRIEGNLAYGSGVMDMKGGLAIMNRALAETLPGIDPDKYEIKVIINPDEEIGSPFSHELIYSTATGAKACLSFEPARKGGGLVCERKGVTSFTVKCGGVRGHAGSAYLSWPQRHTGAVPAHNPTLHAARRRARHIDKHRHDRGRGTAELTWWPTPR